MAQALSISNRTISAIEAEGRALTTEHIWAICDKYNIDARYFFGQIATAEEADLKKRGDDPKLSQLEALRKKIDGLENKVRPFKERDNLAEFLTRPHIRELIELVKIWDKIEVDNIISYAKGLQAGGRLAEERGAVAT